MRLDELESLIDMSFDSKLSGLNSKASSLIEGFDEARRAFLDACEVFGNNESEPDFEYARVANPKHVKEQKGAYISALKRIINDYKVEEKRNAYMSQMSRLAEAKRMMDEMLKLNNKFRLVLEGYSNSLGKFRSAYSLMEKRTRELESKLESRSHDFSEYNRLMGEIEKLKAFVGEIAALERAKDNKGYEAVEAGGGGGLESLRAELSKKAAELDIIERSIDDVKAEISHIVSPIERAARKYVHGIGPSMHLLDYINDPVGRLARNPDAMQDFLRQVEGLRKEIDSDRISIKNRMEALQAISLILKENLSALINEIGVLHGKAGPIISEIEDLKKEVRGLESNEESKKRVEQNARMIEERLGALAKARDGAKRKIEEMAKGYYGLELRVVL